MDTCGSCNATLAPGIDWCPQCYARVGPPQQGLPQAGTTAAGTGPLVVTQPATARELPAELLMSLPEYTRAGSGETIFGRFGRELLSIGVLIVGLIAYFVVMGNIGMSPSWKSFELFLPGFFTVGGAMLWAVWRPGRVTPRPR